MMFKAITKLFQLVMNRLKGHQMFNGLTEKETRNNYSVSGLSKKNCSCGDRYSEKCPGEWEPGCDLGCNEQYVRVFKSEDIGYKLKGN